MNWKIAIIPVLIILVAALGAGCTTTPGPAPTPTPTTTVTQPPATTVTQPPVTPGNCLETGPTDTVDPRFEVIMDIIRDPVSLNKKITVIFQGGKGQLHTQSIDATITREDCSTETKSIVRPESGSIQAGSSVSFNGSNRDRIEVTATINGVPYKIIDQVYSFQTRP
ncbi:MAG: hypothetical protein LUQ49_00195 [Methanomicrobiales archaeon]|nr:hypothetical protein [Methanomicrobiales archaeon]